MVEDGGGGVAGEARILLEDGGGGVAGEARIMVDVKLTGDLRL